MAVFAVIVLTVPLILLRMKLKLTKVVVAPRSTEVKVSSVYKNHSLVIADLMMCRRSHHLAMKLYL